MTQINSAKYDNKIRPFPGYFQVTKFTVKDRDFSDLWIQIDDFESVFDSTKSARISIVDTQNLLKTLPILGGEVVKMTITDGVRTVDYQHRVYRVSDRQQLKQGVLGYTLHLCSEEYWADSFVRVSKSYMNSRLEDTVNDVLKGPLYLKSEKTLLHGETNGPRSVVIPYWSPLHAIVWMGGRAQSADPAYKGGTFMFYETIDGFRWVAVDNLLDSVANVPYATLTYNPLRHSDTDAGDLYDPRGPRDTMNLENLRVVNTLDSLENSRRGMFANRVRTVDLIDRTWKDTDHNYVKSFYDFTHLKGLDGASAVPISGFDVDAANFPEANFRLVFKHKGLFDDEPDGNSRIDEWLPPKLSQMQQLENFKISGTLPGHLGLTAGHIVNFAFPNPENISVNPQSGVDEGYSGEYLVTSVRRMFQRNRFILQVELCKDSRGGSLG
jgi:hypothetical protein